MPVFEPRYAPYIWAVYGLAALMIAGMVLLTALKASKAKRAHEAMVKQKDAPK